jgi:hypothetical protein
MGFMASSGVKIFLIGNYPGLQKEFHFARRGWLEWS